MPSADAIQSYLWGVWNLMNGRAEGQRALDLSADGFWNSFFAIVVALPALFVGWVTLANQFGGDAFGLRLSILTRLAFVDLASWVGPILLFGAIAGRVGLGDRFVAYIVATNWASVIFIWFLLPPSLIGLFWPALADMAALLSLALLMVTLVYSWRLTNAVLAKGPIMASAVFAGMFGVSLIILLTLQSLLGLVPSL